MLQRSVELAKLSSSGPGNKSGHAGLHHRIEPDARGDAVSNLPHRIFWESRKVKALLDALRLGRSAAPCHAPAQQTPAAQSRARDRSRVTPIREDTDAIRSAPWQ